MKTKSILASFLTASIFFGVAFASVTRLEPDSYKNLNKTTVNAPVMDLQNALNSLGYVVKEDENGEPVAPSGIYDEDTVNAIKTLQRENDLEVTGEVNVVTVDTINAMIDFVNSEKEEAIPDTWWEKFLDFVNNLF